jgi:hypothetical protein
MSRSERDLQVLDLLENGEPQIAERLLAFEVSPEMKETIRLVRKYRIAVEKVDGMVHLFVRRDGEAYRIEGVKFYRLDESGCEARCVAESCLRDELVDHFIQMILEKATV